MSIDLKTLAKSAYIYGYPLVYDLTEVVGMTTHPKVATGGPVNLFAHATKLAGPKDEFVSINNDTLYSMAQCDVTQEPLVLHVPDTRGRYYVMQFVDTWTNNFAYAGKRAMGTAEAAFLLAGPGWKGTAPDGLRLIQAPTNVFSIVGRYAVDGEKDVPAVAALQQETWLTPLGRYPARPDTSGRRMGDWDLAPWNEAVPEALQFWEKLRAWMGLFPPPAGDEAFVQSLAPLGLLEDESPYLRPDPTLSGALTAGAKAGQEEIEAITRQGHTKPVNGWLSALHTFDYNLDSLGPGTIDSPQWKLADRGMSYVLRAAAARGGLWGNHGYEAAYQWVYVDDHGDQLNGGRAYTIHFAQTPPVEAFWSVTMYDMPEFYLVENSINRYSIGDRTPGLRYNADGSLEISIQKDSPGAEKESNWLPSPLGDFRPLIRMYQPGEAVLNETYELPPIRRAG